MEENYYAEDYHIKPVDGDDQIELVIHSTDGHVWEYGIPYSRETGRFSFEEISVLELDFGEEFREKIEDEIHKLVEQLVKEGG